MANLTRLSVLVGEADVDRSREVAALLAELGVRRVVQVQTLASLLEALKMQAFDVLICAERLGGEDGALVLRAARNVAPATRCVLMRANDRAGELMPDDVEAIELPFSRLKLQELLHRTAAPHGGLWCEVPELSLTDILQMYHQARRSITVLLSGPIAGRVWLEAGDIVDAEANGERGMSALSLLLEAESGLLRTEPTRGPVSRSISAPFQSVILEAAQKLDERRRDSMNAGPPGAAASAGSVAAGGSASSRYPGPPVDTGLERPSLADTMLRPAMTPPLEAPGPSPERFLVPDRRGRRRSRLGMLGAVLGLAAAGAAAALIGNRLGTSRDPRVNETPEIIATAPGSRPAASEVAESAETPGASRAPDAPANAPAPPVRVPSPAAVPERAVPERAVPERAVPERAATERATRTTEPAPRVAAPAPPVSTSFELNITSKPPRASVYEGNRVLGKTPLRVTISKASVAGGPREFILRLGGYLPVKISQAASGSDVDAAVVLSPRPAVDEVPDGGLYEPELDLADSAGARSGSSKPRRRDLGIRMRR